MMETSPKKMAVNDNVNLSDGVTDDRDAEERGPDEPLDLRGFETISQSFGTGTGQKIVLTSKPVTINQLVKLSS